jgi:CheY-like chemotaxis protein
MAKLMAKAILLVEDSPDDEIIFKHLMLRSGLTNPVMVVRDGDEAIDYLKGEGRFVDRKMHPLPVAVLLDIRMPRLNGYEVLKWIKAQERLRDLLVVVLTRFGSTHEIKQAYDLGANSFLTKPITQMDLENLIAHFRDIWIRSPAKSEEPRKSPSDISSQARLGESHRNADLGYL